MGNLIAAAASSHAFAVEDPAGWDERRKRNRDNYVKRFGQEPVTTIELESDDELQRRSAAIAHGLGHIRRRLAQLGPDALVMVADDQDELFSDGNFPQIAIYLGGDFKARGVDRSAPPHRRRADPALARGIYERAVESEVDMMSVEKLPDDVLISHAFGPVLEVFDPERILPVVPVFLNAVHMPAPSPARCYRLGEVIREAVETDAGGKRVAVVTSGGLSHYPASFPEGHFEGQPFPWGAIDEEFDRWVVERISEGDGRAITDVSSLDLVKHGDVELRGWISVLGSVGSARPELLTYEPIYRGITGMGVAFWALDGK